MGIVGIPGEITVIMFNQLPINSATLVSSAGTCSTFPWNYFCPCPWRVSPSMLPFSGSSLASPVHLSTEHVCVGRYSHGLCYHSGSMGRERKVRMFYKKKWECYSLMPLHGNFHLPQTMDLSYETPIWSQYSFHLWWPQCSLKDSVFADLFFLFLFFCNSIWKDNSWAP